MIQLSSDFDHDTPPPAWILIPSQCHLEPGQQSSTEDDENIRYLIFSLLSRPVVPRSALSALQLSACQFSATSSFQIWEAAVTYQFYVLSRHTWNTIWDKRENQCRHTCPLAHSVIQINIPEMRRTKPGMTEMNEIKKKPEPGAGPSSC